MINWKPTGTEAILRAKESELVAELENREGLAAEAETEFCDQIQRAADRAIVIQALDRNSALLREVRAALARIGEGGYGQCLQCEDPISPKRLAAVPWASLCLKCQEEVDQERADNPTEFEFAACCNRIAMLGVWRIPPVPSRPGYPDRKTKVVRDVEYLSVSVVVNGRHL
jgi:RNA polymerase-binding transcription factor